MNSDKSIPSNILADLCHFVRMTDPATGSGVACKQLQKEHEFLEQSDIKYFDWEKSRAWTWLVGRFGPKISKEELLSLGLVVCHNTGIELTREYKRRKKTMVKWFEDNYDQVMPFIRSSVIVNIKPDDRELKYSDVDPFEVTGQ